MSRFASRLRFVFRGFLARRCGAFFDRGTSDVRTTSTALRVA